MCVAKDEWLIRQTRELCIGLVFDEIRRAEVKFPGWPNNVFEALAIVGEELGEAQKAALDATYGRGPWKDYRKELIQLAAMSLRVLFNDPSLNFDAEPE